ncbi:MAG TPA: caspase family protein [Ramlibacter sp.]|nr:caspase family protein [Ramlibacter sp.]
MSLNILCLHGVNTHEDGGWLATWEQAITFASDRANGRPLDFRARDWRYNDRFAARDTDTEAYRAAFARLWESYWKHRGFAATRADQLATRNIIERTLGMVVKWIAYDELRAELRTALEKQIKESDPHVIVAHSLGSLIAYDLLAQPGKEALLAGRVLVTLGSQVGHPGVRDSFAGKLVPIAGARHWFHLYNPHDLVFTAPLDFTNPDFTQVDCSFNRWGPLDPLDHDAPTYLQHDGACQAVWSRFAASVYRAPAPAAGATATPATKPTPLNGHWFRAPQRVQVRKHHKRRALLVGINDYPQVENRLAGCVNDVFLMSSVLQERGFSADDIRIVLDERATTAGVLQRIDWLLDGVCPGDERVLFFSGHGAQVPTYNMDGEPDHKREALVTWDFDWTANLGISDEDLARRYGDLPYEARLAIILDCCHSGGMVRAGGATVRGIDPPDDVRHRAIRWNAHDRLWVPREMDKLRRMMGRASEAELREYLGPGGDTVRIGRAVPLWSPDPRQARQTARRFGHGGPYNPVVLAACKEEQFAYEYRDGVTSYGAMTYVLAKELRARDGNASIAALVGQCNRQLRSQLGLEQTVSPHVPGPVRQEPFPGDADGMARFGTRRRRKASAATAP